MGHIWFWQIQGVTNPATGNLSQSAGFTPVNLMKQFKLPTNTSNLAQSARYVRIQYFFKLKTLLEVNF
jgi:hypothetical protein